MEDENWDGEEAFLSGNLERDSVRECQECNMEFDGQCAMNSSDCPFMYADDEEEGDIFSDEEDDSGDFEDVDDIDLVLEYDEEAEKLIADEEDIPAEDLLDTKFEDEPDLELDEGEEGEEGDGDAEEDLPQIEEGVVGDFED